MTVALQAAIAMLIYLLLGETELRDNGGTRIATSAAPLAVFPLIFLWKLAAVPAQLHKEQESEEDQRRRFIVGGIAMMYLREVNPPDGDAISYGVASPPQEWVNDRLQAHGYDWRVRFLPGGRSEYHDAG